MQNVEQGVAALATAMGLDDAGLDGAGNMTLIFDGKLPLNVARLDESVMELWTTLPDVGNDLQALRQLLEANHLGQGTGGARLALQPNGGAAVLCERVNVRAMDADALVKRVLDFVRYATFWRSGEVGHGLGGPGVDEPAPSTDAMIFRL